MHWSTQNSAKGPTRGAHRERPIPKTPMRHRLPFALASITAPAIPLACAGAPRAPHETIAPFERRVAAEWEPSLGILITWPFAHPPALVQEWTRDTHLHVVVASEVERGKAARTFADWECDATRVHYIMRPTKEGLYGTRDWAAYAAFDEQGVLSHRDPRYLDYALSGYDSSKTLMWWSKLDPRLDWTSDDETPVAVAKAVGVSREELPFCFTGGNVYADGMGTAFCTEILADENKYFGVPKEKLLESAKQLLGIGNLQFIPNFESSIGAQHIDCVMKLLDEGRILVKRTPADHPDHAQIERIATLLGSMQSPWGRPYEILRIDTPRYQGDLLANYTNSLIHNKTIYVPLFGIAADGDALATFRAAMPGYEVKGFKGNPLFPWTYTDALHCRTKALWDPRMIHLRHTPVRVQPKDGATGLEVKVFDYGKSGVADGGVQLHWRKSGASGWHAMPMAPSSEAGTYQGAIKSADRGAAIEYYISVQTRDGRRETLPRVAPAGYFTISAR